MIDPEHLDNPVEPNYERQIAQFRRQLRMALTSAASLPVWGASELVDTDKNLINAALRLMFIVAFTSIINTVTDNPRRGN